MEKRALLRTFLCYSSAVRGVVVVIFVFISMSTSNANRSLVVATRLHLGNASTPPEKDKLDSNVLKFRRFASRIGAASAAIAVDATPKIDGYDLVSSVRQACAEANVEDDETLVPCRIIPVTPWGKFVPALNALVIDAAMQKADLCLFCSAETEASTETVQSLCNHIDDKTLVAGALLPGHDYHENETVPLDGRTTPWNTLAVWRVAKLALTGFALVSDGLHPNPDGSDGAGGVEEAVAIAVQQKILGEERALAKLVKLPDVEWEQEWPDEERRKWHERKMKSKVERAGRQLELMGLTGWVSHC